MIFIRSLDGVAVDRRARKPSVEVINVGTPEEANVHLTEFSDEGILNDNNWYIADETPIRPADDINNTYRATIVNTGPGVFEQQWFHDAAAHQQRIDSEVDEVLKSQLRNRVATFRAGTATSAQVQTALADLIVTVHGGL